MKDELIIGPKFKLGEIHSKGQNRKIKQNARSVTALLNSIKAGTHESSDEEFGYENNQNNRTVSTQKVVDQKKLKEIINQSK